MHFIEKGLVNDRRYSVLYDYIIISVHAYVPVVPKNPIQTVLIKSVSSGSLVPLFIKVSNNLILRLPLRVQSEDFLYSFRLHGVNFILSVFSYFISETYRSHSDSMESVFLETSLDTPGEVF